MVRNSEPTAWCWVTSRWACVVLFCDNNTAAAFYQRLRITLIAAADRLVMCAPSSFCRNPDLSLAHSFGQNNYGQLGLGDTDDRGQSAGTMGDSLAAVDLGTGTTVVAMSAGSDHTCAVLADGSLKVWCVTTDELPI